MQDSHKFLHMTCIWRPLRNFENPFCCTQKVRFDQMSHECQMKLGIILNNKTLCFQTLRCLLACQLLQARMYKKDQKQKIKLRQSLVVSRIYKKSSIWFSFTSMGKSVKPQTHKQAFLPKSHYTRTGFDHQGLVQPWGS